MSLNAVLWVIHLPRDRVSGGPRDVLALLADRANHDGTAAWPSAKELAAILGVTVRTIRRHLVELEDMGLIRRGNQRFVEYLPGNRRPIVWDLVLGPAPVDNSPLRGDTAVTPETGESAPGVTETAARGDSHGSPGVTTAVLENRPLPSRTPHARARARGRAIHNLEPNARRALDTIRRERRLPLDVDELLEMAYEAGGGDPWRGYLQVKDATTSDLETARDVRAVVRKRLGLEPAAAVTTRPPRAPARRPARKRGRR